MYYANYLVFLERALCSLTNNHCSRIANIKTIKFKKPALLGDTIEIKMKTKNNLLSASILRYVSDNNNNNDDIELLSASKIAFKKYTEYSKDLRYYYLHHYRFHYHHYCHQ